MSPPLRAKEKQEDLWRGLAVNDLQVVATDHCPFCMKDQKELGKDDFSKIPNGMPGIETRMSPDLRRRRARRPHLDEPLRRDHLDRAGEDLRPLPAQGHDRASAPTPTSSSSTPRSETTLSAKTHHMRVDYTPYEGRRVKGVADAVLSRGEVIIEGGKLAAKPGRGRYLKRSAR